LAKRRRRRSARPDASASSHDGRVGALALASAVVAGVLYAPTLGFAFVNWDDWEYVLFNPHLDAFDLEFVGWCLTAFHSSNWIPATFLSLGLDHALWGKDPTGYHLTNVVLHAANTALATRLAWELFRRSAGTGAATLFGTAVVGLVFACHPLHVESVAWVSERKDVLYAFFWLASLLAWLAYATPDASQRRRRRAYALALGAYALSALSKPMAVTLPLVLLLLDVWPLGRLRRASGPHHGRDLLRVAVTEKLPFYAVSLATGALAWAAQGARGAIEKAGLGPVERLWVAVDALGGYLASWLAPLHLVPFHPLDAEIAPLQRPLEHWTALVSLAGLAGLVALSVALRRRAPWGAAGLAFSVVTLLPVLGLVQLGFHSAADRYMYVPLLGPTWVAGAGAIAAWRVGGRPRVAAAGVAAAFVAFLAWRTTGQLPVWRSSTSLWTHVVAAYPDSELARYNLGHAHAVAGRPERARAEWERALAIDPVYAPALYELGAAAGRAGDYGEARRHLEALVAADPAHARGRIDLARVLDALGERRAAATHYRAFLRVAPPELAEQARLARAKLAEPGREVP